MNIMAKLALPVCLFAAIMLRTGSAGSVPNLTEACFLCLCSVTTNCDRTNECFGGYCGPFNISRVYWADAGKPLLTDVKLDNTETKPDDLTVIKLDDRAEITLDDRAEVKVNDTEVKLDDATEVKPENTEEVKQGDKTVIHPRVGRIRHAETTVLDKEALETMKSHEDYVKCALNYECSKLVIEGYMKKYGKDCNGDGITNCYDYMLVHGLGSWGCSAGLENHRNGPAWLKRYAECKLE